MRQIARSFTHEVRRDADLWCCVLRTLEYMYEGRYRGGYDVLSGNSTITIIAAGYVRETHYVTFSSVSRYFQLFAVPNDGQTRAAGMYKTIPRTLDTCSRSGRRHSRLPALSQCWRDSDYGVV
jgi:hypothetical protein